MRTKQIIPGFNNNQKIRVIVDGVGVYTSIARLSSTFATGMHYRAAQLSILQLAEDAKAAKAQNKLVPSGLAWTAPNGVQVQVDLV